MTSMYSKPLPLEEFVKDFEESITFKNWDIRMRSEGLTHLHSFIVDIEPDESLTVLKKTIPENERSLFHDHWENWKGRFSYWVLTQK